MTKLFKYLKQSWVAIFTILILLDVYKRQVMDETTCMVDMARYFLDFTRKESCGKCNYCRIGTKRMLEILERITNGEGKDGDIELLEELAYKVKDLSLIHI